MVSGTSSFLSNQRLLGWLSNIISYLVVELLLLVVVVVLLLLVVMVVVVVVVLVVVVLVLVLVLVVVVVVVVVVVDYLDGTVKTMQCVFVFRVRCTGYTRCV